MADVNATTSKRAHADVDKENRAATVKVEDGAKKTRVETSLTAETLPPPSSTFVQLRFQLARFKGVYRVIRVPLNYTFANLYKLIIFVFGWHGDHLHRAHAGHFKRGGKLGPWPPGDPLDVDHPLYRIYEMERRQDVAEYEVVMKGGRRREVKEAEYFGDIPDTEAIVEDQDLCLSQVWNPKARKNASKGACGNKEVGVKFEYDLGDCWEVHITMDNEDFFTVKPPSNLPIMVTSKNKGAPPIEDVHHDILGEIEAHRKTLSALLFYSPNIFARYLRGEVDSVAGKTSLEVHLVGAPGEPGARNEEDDGDDDVDAEGEDDDDDEFQNPFWFTLQFLDSK
ncbi:hypothetical protein FB45DRAFT_1005187 [Roridomyces roridus]|uniref:Plasmid pRiA4b Orf3-like domain-containing protein n=1 Tax=Roridomyces roridus TaxID=1738132 RepID=A0AAD7BN41_9AGAR|nr:hypothetical protein FB45DRAFT_1005187 [Roridomyces roridus]